MPDLESKMGTTRTALKTYINKREFYDRESSRILAEELTEMAIAVCEPNAITLGATA